MANIPTPRSFNAILGDMVDAFISRFGLKGLRRGSPVLSILEAAAQSDLRSTQDVFDLLNATSLDRATGLSLDRIAADENLTRITDSPASGVVTISDSSFTKKSTRIYQGLAAPIVGSNVINIVDASDFPNTGSIYIGRGTTNYEGPLAYSAKTNNGTHWTLTLSDVTKKIHNTGESIVLAQGGNRTISAGAIVQTPQGNSADAIQFSVLYSVTIPDGEISISNVNVVAQKPGVIGNVASNSINAFVSQPFNGAAVTNPLPFTNGQSTEDDNTFRERIRSVRQSRSLGTPLAIKTSIAGATAFDENKRITSTSVVVRQGEPTTVYIDDGTGYEERSLGVAIESLVDRANGGEQYFQLINTPVAKAFLRSTALAPFNLIASSQLCVLVGGVSYTHTFDESEFRNIENASAYEVVASINSNSNLEFMARTSNSGTQIEVFSKRDQNEDLQIGSVQGEDANDVFLFSSSKVETLKLYLNDKLLSKDGKAAILQSKPFSEWGVLSNGDTLIVDVDETGPVTYTFNDNDFANLSTGFITVGKNTVNAWVSVLNKKIPGITATSSAGVISLRSNSGNSSRASIKIISGGLVTKNMFAGSQEAKGEDKDYTLDRNLGQIKLEKPLSTGDKLSAGTLYSRAFISSQPITSTTSIASSGGNLWFVVDGNAKILPTSVNSSVNLSTTLASTQFWGNRIRLTAATSAFTNVKSGDWAILWDSNIPLNARGMYRVASTSSTWVELERKCMSAARAQHTATKLNSGWVLVAGGRAGTNIALAQTEIFNGSDWVVKSPMVTPRYGHSAVLLGDGKVLVMGGITSSGVATDKCEIYNPSTELWTSCSPLPAPRALGVAGYMSSGNRVVFAGGQDATGTAKAETYTYDVSTDTWSSSTTMSVARVRATGTVLSSTKFLVAGGDNGSVVHNSATVYDSSINSWAATSNTMIYARTGHAASLLSDGKVLITGGSASVNLSSPLTLTSLFDPATNQFSSGVSMATGRVLHSQATLSNGRVLVAQGRGVDSSELYNHSTTSWSTVSGAQPLGTARESASLVPLSSVNALYSGGDATGDGGAYTVATSSIYVSDSWTTNSNSTINNSFNLSSNGIVFASSPEQVQKVALAQNLYLASTFSSTIASQLLGATPSVYKTNTLRVTTNTLADGGDIALVAADSEGLKTLLTTNDAEENTGSHLASVNSGNSYGTPTFEIHEVLAQEGSSILHLSGDVKSSSQVLGSLEMWDGSLQRFGNQYSFISAVKESSSRSGSTSVNLRSSPGEVLPRAPMWQASSLAIGPQDSLVVVADGDTTSKRYVIPMWRKVKPSGNYGSTITLKDADNLNSTLATAFGLGFDFNDFALYQSARTITDSAVSSKSILWRYKRLGPDGNAASVRWVYPKAANSTISVFTNSRFDNKTRIDVSLASGAAKTGYSINASSKIGLNAQSSGSLHRLTYTLGFPIASATRDTRLDFSSQSTPGFVVGTTVLGAVSNATGTIQSVSSSDPTGTLVLTGVTGIFSTGENLLVSSVVKGVAVKPQYQRVAMTLTAPPVGGITSHGLSSGQSVFVSGSGSFGSGLKTLTEASGLTIAYLESGTDGTATNPGTVSNDISPVTLTGTTPAVAVGDILTIGSSSGLDSNWEKTIRIDSVGAQYISGLVENFGGSTSTTPNWQMLNDTNSFSIYPLQGNSVSTIVSSVNAIQESPVTLKAMGDGTGVISTSTMEQELSPNYWYNLTDGVNYIKNTISPALITNDYQFDLKDAVSSALSGGNSDWTNEDVRLVPVSSSSIVKWLNSTGVSGLSGSCEIKLASGGKNVQIASLTPGSLGSIQVQGGAANSSFATVVGSSDLISSTYPVSIVPSSDSQGLMSGSWVSLDNTISMPKNVLGVGTILQSIDIDGTVVVDSPIYTTSSATIAGKSWTVTKQGNFVCLTHRMLNSTDIASITASEGDWVRITPPASVVVQSLNELNCGIFRVVRIQNSNLTKAIWIENPNAVEDFGECNINFYTFDSIMPGDELSINTDLWGADNKGKWLVSDVGNGFTENTKFKLSTSERSPVAIVSPVSPLTASEAKLIQLLEASPSRLIKQILTISPNGTEFADVKFTTPAGWGFVSESAGTVITSLDKMSFDIDAVVGVDGYSYNMGLIREANKILYGDPRDSAKYPGVVAAGANVNISGPIVKRIQVGISLRTKSGISTVDIASRVRSAVASEINATNVGESIAISDIVSAASQVNGVLAVAITSPSYTSSSDLISVQPQEKPLVLSLEQDITISFASE